MQSSLIRRIELWEELGACDVMLLDAEIKADVSTPKSGFSIESKNCSLQYESFHLDTETSGRLMYARHNSDVRLDADVLKVVPCDDDDDDDDVSANLRGVFSLKSKREATSLNNCCRLCLPSDLHDECRL